MEPKIRILVVDGQQIVREGVKLLLETAHDLQVVGEANNGERAVALVKSEQPDVILTGIELAEGGVSFADFANFRSVAKEAKILLLTGVNDLDAHFKAILEGARGVVRKAEAGDVLIKAIRKIASGEVWLGGMLTAKLVHELVVLRSHEQQTFTNLPVMTVAPFRCLDAGKGMDEAARIAQLTEREREVISLIGEGLRNQQIADRLAISVITVRHHLSSIFAKLDVGDRFELAIYAYRHGLAKLPL